MVKKFTYKEMLRLEISAAHGPCITFNYAWCKIKEVGMKYLHICIHFYFRLEKTIKYYAFK